MIATSLLASPWAFAQGVAKASAPPEAPVTLLPAQRRTAIALVAGRGDRELPARLRAELVALGWRVVETEPGADLALAKIARRAGTLAVVRIGREADGIEVWVAPEVSAEASSEWIDVENARPDLAVVRAVEALRARFLELGLEPEPAPREETSVAAREADASKPDAPAERAVVAPQVDNGRTTVERAESAPLPPSLSGRERPDDSAALLLRAQGAGTYSPGGLGVSPELVLGVRFEPSAAWSLGAEFWFPPSATEFTTSGGSSDVRIYFAALSLEYRFAGPAFVGSLGGGVGGSLFDVEGEAAPGYLGRSERVTSLLPFFRAAGAYRLATRLSLRLDGTLGVSFPRARLRFDGQDVAFWGRPLIAAGLGLEWSVWD